MLSSVIFALATLFLVWVVKRLLLLWRLPPGPWGLPLIGSGLELDIGKLPELLTKWHRKHGDIFSLTLPVHQDIVVVSNDELIHEVLVKRSAEFAGRPNSIRIYGILDGNVNIGLVNDTPHWRVLKKALIVSLKMYGERLILLEEIATSAVQHMVEKWRKQSGNIINPRNDISDVVYKIISSLVFRKEFSEKEAELWVDISFRFFSAFTDRAQYLELFPWLRYLPNADWTFLQDTNKEMMSFINSQIKQRLKDFDGTNPECTLDALKLYQKKYNKDNTENVISDINISHMAADLMAGVTTMQRITYTILAILADPNHADIVRKMHKEIQTNIGRETPRLADKHKLPYVEAVIFESLRYWTLGAIMNPHAALVDTTLAGFTVPKGTWIWPNVLNLQHDTRYWDHPWKFKPERFLDENGEIVPQNHLNRKRLFAFGAGIRFCPGEVLAKNRLFLIITSIVQNFEVSQAPGKTKPNHDCRRNFTGGLITRPEDYEILIHSRQG